jgi:hypothetical protein
MTTVLAALLLLAIVILLFLLAKALGQNRGLAGRIRASGRPVRVVLRETLALWSPLGLVIVLLCVVSNRLGASAIGLAYRLTTLDEFCAVNGAPPAFAMPCTGLPARLPHDKVRAAGTAADLAALVSDRYSARRLELLPVADGRQDATQAASGAPGPDGLGRPNVSPLSVLGLERAPEDEPELVRMKGELRALIAAPTAPAANLLDTMRFMGERDVRTHRLRELTALVRARREQVNARAYAGLPTAAQARLFLRHRLAHLLATAVPSPRTASTTPAATALRLARDEAAVLRLVAREAATPKGAAGLAIALSPPRQCTVAAPAPQLQWSRDAVAAEAGAALSGVEGLLQSNGGTFACDAIARAPEPLLLSSLGFHESVQRSIARWFDAATRASVQQLGALSLDGAEAAGDQGAVARAISDAMPGRIALGRSECNWLHPGNCAANAARAGTEDAMAAALGAAQLRSSHAAGEAATAVSQGLDARIGEALLQVEARSGAMRASALQWSDDLFLLGNLVRLVGWLALLLVTTKSFLYVLALDLYRDGGPMSLGFDAAPAIQGELRVGKRITIDRAFPWAMITRKQLSNTDNDIRIAPWPRSAIIGRILGGRYFLFTRGQFLADAGHVPAPGDAPLGMVASAGGGHSIAEWQLLPGEEVVFRYRDFYGASENVRLSTEISLRLSTLLLGRVLFRIARCEDGPGRLLLKADVEANLQDDLRAVPPERMLAWNRHARFSVHSGRSARSILLNGYTLLRRNPAEGPPGRILVSSEDAGWNLGSIRFLRRIVSAIF